ncbi:hypothetical protein F2Q68_00028131 [Brassica cretica]|uniref:Uncharacterized protein n=1 Tax=Brassica cretica TaxID=69181 RepID=A0A8S9IFN6_BRACR|nr:hypothetical protein F2Q68_00028131 [Brassica cretica]
MLLTEVRRGLKLVFSWRHHQLDNISGSASLERENLTSSLSYGRQALRYAPLGVKPPLLLRFLAVVVPLQAAAGFLFRFFLRLSLFVGPWRSPASEACPSFASGVDLESSLHLGQSVVCGSARGRVAALRNPIYSWCAPSVWLRGGGGVTVGQCRVGLEDSRISSSLSPPSASDRWWARQYWSLRLRLAPWQRKQVIVQSPFGGVDLAVLEKRQLENRTIHSSAVCFRRVSFLAVCFLYMSSRFNGCIRSRWDEMETANFRLSLRTTTSSLGLGSVFGSCRSRCIKV